MKNYARRCGFTLVELLIVIVVIGILSAMMMLSSTEAVSSAKAAKIISDLRNLKTAALAWYADNLDYVESDKFVDLYSNTDAILKYLGNEGIKGDYVFSDASNKVATDKMAWFIWWKVDRSDKRLLEKLAQRSSVVKLRYSHYDNDCSPSPGLFTGDDGRIKIIGLHIRGRWAYNSANGSEHPDSD